jgi:subtilisin family serine protease
MSSHSMNRRAAAIRTAVGALALAAATVTAIAAEPWDRKPAFLDKRAPAAQSSAGGGAAAALETQARKEGRIRVIVGLAVAMTADEEKAPMAAAAEQQSLKSVQDAVIAATYGRRTATSSAADGEDARVRRFETIPFLSMVVTSSELRRLIADGRVTTIQEDVAVPPTLLDSIPLIKANRAHARGIDGRGVTVAVLDTGVDLKHPMFGDRIKAGACFSSTVAGQSTSVCPGGAQTSTEKRSGKNCAVSIFGCDHGTHVASIAVGDGDGRKGVAPRANLIAVQVFSRFDNPADCGSAPAPCVLSFNTDQVAGLERVFKLRKKFTIASINMSLGGGQFFAACDGNNPAFTAIVEKLRGKGIATAIASGNNGFDGSISSPACVSAAIAVGSTTKDDFVSSFSNHSVLVDLLAPGSSITAAVPGGIGTKSGTSMATPHVAGAFAVLRQSKKDARVPDIEKALESTGVAIGRAGVFKPRIDVNAARKALKAAGS